MKNLLILPVILLIIYWGSDVEDADKNTKHCLGILLFNHHRISFSRPPAYSITKIIYIGIYYYIITSVNRKKKITSICLFI
ncbi:MAG: hypothetical protein KAR21_15665 [Spirochaetales bacterium]|nr:hypothetical protein [Spirochaetales bacterium]